MSQRSPRDRRRRVKVALCVVTSALVLLAASVSIRYFSDINYIFADTLAALSIGIMCGGFAMINISD